MAKSAYLIVSDLHDFYKNLENRVDYVGEIEFVKEHILEVGLKYRNLGYEVNIILLGDVFHRAYQDVNAAVISNNFWVISKKLFKHIYCVIGNHETSYYSNNPFYTLVSEIKSKKMQTVLNKVYTPRGLDNVFEVVDAVEDGDVVFHFNHYGCSISHDLLSKYTENKYLLQILQANYDGRFNSNFITMYLEDDSTLADRIANDLRDNVLDWSLVSQLGGNYFVPRIIASLEELYLDTIEVRKIAIENTEMQQLFGNYAKNVVTAWVNGEITDNDYYLYCTIALYNNFEDLMKRFIRFPSVYHFNQFAVNCLFIEFTDNCANLPEIGSLIVIDTGKHYSYVGVDSILADVQLFAEALELEIPRDDAFYSEEGLFN